MIDLDGGPFPAAACAVLREGREVLALGAGGAGPDTPFDVASLTKALVTTPVALRLAAAGAVDLDHPGPGGFTLRQLLAHTAGFPAWRPLFEVEEARPVFLRPSTSGSVELVAGRFAQARAAVLRAARATPLEFAPGERALYSDLGFLVLGALLEEASGERLDALYRRHVAEPLGLRAYFWDLASAPLGPDLDLRAPATGRMRPRPGNPSGGTLSPRDLGGDPLPDDDHAYAMGGLAPHAGLFASARDVARAGEALRRAAEGDASWLDPALARECFRRQGPAGSTRALGLDTPSPEGSQAGTRLGQGLRGAAGHLGFTGCSLWIDLDLCAVVALCTNAVARARPAVELRIWRPRWHDAVADAVLS